jgi:succinylarginine dihydrolase
MSAQQINFDGLVGLTHNYAGLSEGNIASARNKDTTARPKDAALQGLHKMRALATRGLSQGILPPHERPFLPMLRALGFSGSDSAIWEKAWTQEPRLARNLVAASSMWAANAATISPSADCADGRLHATPANLVTMLHRSIEAPTTTRALRRLMPDEALFCVHDALPPHSAFGDEGAANHMRLAPCAGAAGVEIFVYGRAGEESGHGFPARQTEEACRAVARAHGLNPGRTVFIQQSRAAIESGAFHNDVVAVANETTLFFHALAFENKEAALAAIRRAAAGLFEPLFIEVSPNDVPLADAVSSYLFNAQLVRAPGDARQTLIAPEEAQEAPRARSLLEGLARANGPIGDVMFLDVRESMRNGGGPACLRLRIEMTDVERAKASQGFFWTPQLDERLSAWVNAHYRETLAPADLRDPALISESHTALDALTQILPLGSDFYDFQRA